MTFPLIHCRHFSGYKPCDKNAACDESCEKKDLIEHSILIIHLGAIGAVVRSTSLLSAIKRKYPKSYVTWVTDKPCDQILRGRTSIDRVVTSQEADLQILRSLEFDVAYCIDKSLKASSILEIPRKIHRIEGFISIAKTGGIIPAQPEATELWEIGLSDAKKFYYNQKPETQLLIEALNLGPFQRDEYQLTLNSSEQIEVLNRKRKWSEQGKKYVIGINTGCSSYLPYKKLSIAFQRELIQKISINPIYQIVLLGGPEDTERNQAIARGLDVVSSPTESGLCDGLMSVAACDIVVTGDSLGMHMAISQKKWVVAWFGPTCEQEIDLYSRGIKILSSAPCAPCWKRSCQKTVMCYDLVSIEQILSAIDKGKNYWQSTSLTKQPFLEICS